MKENDERKDESPETSELDIVFHDDDIVVMNKPHGLRTVPGKASGAEAETRAHVSFKEGGVNCSGLGVAVDPVPNILIQEDRGTLPRKKIPNTNICVSEGLATAEVSNVDGPTTACMYSLSYAAVAHMCGTIVWGAVPTMHIHAGTCRKRLSKCFSVTEVGIILLHFLSPFLPSSSELP